MNGKPSHTLRYRWLGSALTPVLSIRLVRRGGEVLAPVLAILDSGADSTTFPSEWASSLGIDLEHDCVEQPCGTAGGETISYAYPGDVEAIVLGERLSLSATFSPGLDFALLGRRDFFYWFRVSFDQRAKSFTLQRYAESGEA